MSVSNYPKPQEEGIMARFSAIKEKYRRGDAIALGEATPEELLELGRLKREIDELQALLARMEEIPSTDEANAN
jgi:hypothetical protein